MKKSLFIITLAVCGTAFSFLSCHQKEQPPEQQIAQALIKQVDSFSNDCKRMLTEAVNKNCSEHKLQQCFLQTRIAYKKFEWASEYFEPVTSRFVNGPPVPETEISGQTFQPAGLQIIEGFLFPKFDTAKRTELISQLNLLQSKCQVYKMHFTNVDILNWQVFDAVKLEVFRIETLGITGFDDPLSLKFADESKAGLQSLQQVMAYYKAQNNEDLPAKFTNAINYLSANKNFDAFDRAIFITAYCNPLTKSIADLESTLNFPVIKYNRLLNQEAKTLFDTNAFNVNAYAPDQPAFITNEKIALGKKLFSDPVLSGNGIRSCESCHQPDKAFTDGLVKNTMINSNQTLARNTPTLINAALQAAQFYDMRANTLEDQSHDVVQSAVEMHGSMQLSVQKLWNDSAYRKLFSIAFPKKNRTNIDTLEVMNAIGSYVRSLVLLNSRFDKYMRGDNNALTPAEVNGFNLFMGKAKCATCHYMPLFNGTFPPRYMKTEVEVIGVPSSLEENKLDSDLGRYNIIPVASLKYAFKIPTLRNAEKTAPYMHNGVFTNLQQVMDFYNKGGGVGLGFKIDNQTLPFDKLNLSQTETEDVIAFIKSLNSE